MAEQYDDFEEELNDVYVDTGSGSDNDYTDDGLESELNESVGGGAPQSGGDVVARKHFESYRAAAIVLTVFALLLALILIVVIILYQFYASNDGDHITTFVYDADGNDWSDYEDLPIFYDGEFGTNTVKPYSSGSYEFIFSNQSEYRVTYSIVLTEVNEYDIAMVYRLECDGYYVVDSSVRTDDFICMDLTLEGLSSHYFVLDWYWDGDVSDYNDTLAGMNEAFYELTITITAASIAE